MRQQDGKMKYRSELTWSSDMLFILRNTSWQGIMGTLSIIADLADLSRTIGRVSRKHSRTREDAVIFPLRCAVDHTEREAVLVVWPSTHSEAAGTSVVKYPLQSCTTGKRYAIRLSAYPRTGAAGRSITSYTISNARSSGCDYPNYAFPTLFNKLFAFCKNPPGFAPACPFATPCACCFDRSSA